MAYLLLFCKSIVKNTLTNWNAFQRPLLVGLSENVVILVWVSFGQFRIVKVSLAFRLALVSLDQKFLRCFGILGYFLEPLLLF